MAYTPELSSYQSAALRRIAWALGVPMTKAMNDILEYIFNVIDSRRVCTACKDKSRCSNCPFSRPNNT